MITPCFLTFCKVFFCFLCFVRFSLRYNLLDIYKHLIRGKDEKRIAFKKERDNLPLSFLHKF